FKKVLAESPGVRIDNVLTASVSLYRRADPSYLFWDRLMTDVRALPGVRAASAVNMVPLGVAGSGYLEVEGWEGMASGGYRLVTDDYFATMDIRVLRGREFTALDDSTHPHVSLVNQTMADMYWKGKDPIGQRFRAKSWDSHPDVWFTVIGVVNDIRYWSLESAPRPEHFVYFRQRPDRLQMMTLMVHTTGDPLALVPAVRQAIKAIDPNVAAEFSSMSRRRAETLQLRRFIMTLLGAFAGFGLFLAAIGIYGVLSYVTNSRTREIGVRVALGAPRAGVIRLVFQQAAVPIVLGLVGGIGAAFGLSRLMESMLYGVEPVDPLTYLVAPLTFGVTAFLACLIPAWRALRVDPLSAIRSD
ncbi:MAG: FtsX-like permease family protein, partial [Gemmatimonadales bacterium]|nr:FtsX-like permease family protein [Gemmatimonadales bacterium]